MKTFEVLKRNRSGHVMHPPPVSVPSVVTASRPRQDLVRNIIRAPILQTKLTVSEPGDVYEQEADRVADEVMRMPEPELQRQAEEGEEEEEELPSQPAEGVDGGQQETVQAKPRSTLTPVPEIMSQVLALRGQGRSLPDSARRFFEPRFGHDFSRVRVHTDANANETANALGARAFAVDSAIVFGAGEFSPETPVGGRLLAHELVHVIQQRDAFQLHRKAGRKRRPARGQKVPLEAGVSRKEYERDRKVNELSHFLHDIKDSLGRNKTAWDIAYRTLGSAYYTAYNRHETAVKDAAREKALSEAIAFGILTAISVGALGWIGEALQAGKEALGKGLKRFMAAALEDAVQAAVGEAIDVVQMKVAPTAVIVDKSPFLFQNQLLNANDDQWLKVQDYFVSLQRELKKCQAERPWALDRIDLKESEKWINNWLRNNRMMKTPRKLDGKEMADELERGIWAKWARILVQVVRSPDWIRAKGYTYTVYAKPGEHVEARLNELGITKAAGIGKTFGWWTFDSDIEKYVFWGLTYKERKFRF